MIEGSRSESWKNCNEVWKKKAGSSPHIVKSLAFLRLDGFSIVIGVLFFSVLILWVALFFLFWLEGIRGRPYLFCFGVLGLFIWRGIMLSTRDWYKKSTTASIKLFYNCFKGEGERLDLWILDFSCWDISYLFGIKRLFLAYGLSALVFFTFFILFVVYLHLESDYLPCFFERDHLSYFMNIVRHLPG